MPPRTLSKSAFIRSLGKIPAKEAVAKGKAAGLTFSVNYVYNVRRGLFVAEKSRRVVRIGRPSNSARRGGQLSATIDQLAKKFVEQILASLRGASLADVLGG